MSRQTENEFATAAEILDAHSGAISNETLQTPQSTSASVSRRSFLRASGVMGLGLATLAGCAPKTATDSADAEPEGIADAEDAESDAIKQAIDAAIAEEERGTWITAPCWHDCGSRCVNRVLVVDGKVIRQATDESHEDTPEYLQQRSCPRGHSQRRQVYAADRIQYPMKRKHWEPETGGDKQLRGEDEWERISWEEALDLVAAEIARVKDTYGNRAIYKPDCTGNGDEIATVLNAYGGFTDCWSPMSFGTWALTAMRVAGPPSWFPVPSSYAIMMWGGANDRLDLVNCDYVVMLSSNPAWSAMGMASMALRRAKESGVKFVGVDPFYNDTIAMTGAEWVPCRPGADTAFMMGVAYAMLDRDEQEGLIDWDFLHTYCVGFDDESMPADAATDENLMGYLLGEYDGIPKTPEWASEICGAPVEQINHVAEIMGKNNNVALLAGYASSRTSNADNMPQMLFALGAMGGHIGRPGNMTGLSSHMFAYNGGPGLINGGVNGMPAFENPVDDTVPSFQAWRAVLEGEYDLTSGLRNLNGFFDVRETEHREIDLHMIYHCYGQSMLTNEDLNSAIEAHRAVDFVVTQAYTFTTNAKYSDIVLPVSTPWERPGSQYMCNRECTLVPSQVIEPLYEAQDDQWIAEQLAQRLGLDAQEIFPFNRKQQQLNLIMGTTITLEDGMTVVPLATVTQEDLDAYGVQGEPQEGQVALAELLERGNWQVERHEGDNFGHIAFKPFIDDPENMPLTTASGKFELYCQTLADTVNAMGFSQIKPYPTYIAPERGYEATFVDGDTNGSKGEFPLQMYSIHYLRRAHTAFENVDWLRETWTAPIFMSAADARERGIETGDAVEVRNEFGTVLRRASVTERMMPGVCAITHGAWSKKNAQGIDVAGPDSALTAPSSTGQGQGAYNSQIVDIAKYQDEELGADCEFPIVDELGIV